MERICLNMPLVSECKVTECGYNVSNSCHARAITVGSERPACETYFQSSQHTTHDSVAGVGACRVDVCKHNESFECQAPSIFVDQGPDKADCVTFEQR